jgi:hypothetical protein
VTTGASKWSPFSDCTSLIGGGVSNCLEMGPQECPCLVIGEGVTIHIDIEVGAEGVPSSFDIQAHDVHRSQ